MNNIALMMLILLSLSLAFIAAIVVFVTARETLRTLRHQGLASTGYRAHIEARQHEWAARCDQKGYARRMRRVRMIQRHYTVDRWVDLAQWLAMSAVLVGCLCMVAARFQRHPPLGLVVKGLLLELTALGLFVLLFWWQVRRTQRRIEQYVARGGSLKRATD